MSPGSSNYISAPLPAWRLANSAFPAGGWERELDMFVLLLMLLDLIFSNVPAAIVA
jgi:hypothetical protein